MRWATVAALFAALGMASCGYASQSSFLCEDTTGTLSEPETGAPEPPWSLTFSEYPWLSRTMSKSWGALQVSSPVASFYPHVTEASGLLLIRKGKGEPVVGRFDRLTGKLQIVVGNDHIRLDCSPAIPMV